MIELLTYSIALFLGSIGLLYISQRINASNGFAYEFDRNEHLFTGGLGVLFGTFLFLHQDALGGVEALPYLAPLIVLFATQFTMDIKYLELADEWNVLIGVTTLFYVLYFPEGMFGFRLWSVAMLTFIFFLMWFLTGGLGLGDVKFIFAAGALLPISDVPRYISIAFGMAIVYAFLKKAKHNMLFKREGRNQEFAFGPFLILGMVLMLVL